MVLEKSFSISKVIDLKFMNHWHQCIIWVQEDGFSNLFSKVNVRLTDDHSGGIWLVKSAIELALVWNPSKQFKAHELDHNDFGDNFLLLTLCWHFLEIDGRVISVNFFGDACANNLARKVYEKFFDVMFIEWTGSCPRISGTGLSDRRSLWISV